MWPFEKKLKPAPRDLDLSFEGTVKRIQFNPGGGFKMTVDQNGKIAEWWVPNDPGNRHCAFIRQWICDGGFPEDPDYVPPKRWMGLLPETWARIGQILSVAAAVGATIAAFLALRSA